MDFLYKVHQRESPLYSTCNVCPSVWLSMLS